VTVLPKARRHLMRHELDEETLVYDAAEDRVHLLDPTTGKIFVWLEEGSLGRSQIISELERLCESASGEIILDLALDQLAGAGLLESTGSPGRLSEVNRREMVKKAALTGIAALFVPAVVSLSASAAYAQGSCLPQCAPCVRDSQCCTHCDANGATRCGLARDVCP